MKQDLEAVIMVINYYLDRSKATIPDTVNGLTEKEKDKDFWSAL